ncbi:MAG TPA: hypothetical protein VFR90_12485 [Methylibium sp.]|nr:hypothetical protein [Methylibium sp.]
MAALQRKVFSHEIHSRKTRPTNSEPPDDIAVIKEGTRDLPTTITAHATLGC